MPTLNELLHAASRTFAIGIDLLPEPLREEVRVAYLLLRVSDYLEDNVSMEPGRKAELLGRWAGVLEGRDAPEALSAAIGVVREETPDALVAAHLTQVHQALRAQRPAARAIVERHVRDSTLGMERWAVRGPDFADEGDLDDYMHEVAGRVGWLLTELFALDVRDVARRRDEMLELGREFGLALQTVNVIRGLHSDWERGWVFIPRSFLEGPGAEAVALFSADSRDAVRERTVLERLVRKAERHLEAARAYIGLIPRRCHGIRLFCLLPYFFAVRTLAVSRGNARVFEEETKIRREEVRRIVGASRLLGWSHAWVRWYSARLARPSTPLPEPS